MDESIVLYSNKDQCCGCAACYTVCPAKAITMLPDEEGFLYPNIDHAKCIGCKRCINICVFKKNQMEKGF